MKSLVVVTFAAVLLLASAWGDGGQLGATAAAPAYAQDATGKIAFTSDRDDPNPSTCLPSCNSEIYVMGTDGSGQTRLTNDPARDVEPAWSPDGSRIAFASDRDGDFGIYVMNADGSGQTELIGGGASGPAWSPDGSRIAFGEFPSIFVMNADGSNQTELISGGAGGPAWSPDGTRIAFSLTTDVPSTAPRNRPHIYVMNADGSNQVLLTVPNPETSNFAPAWSPDGTQIAFFSDHLGDVGIHVMNADGSGQTFLADAGFAGVPTWSPDGSRIAYTSGPGLGSEIFVMNADSSGQTNLTNNPARDSDPAWSPQAIAEPTPTPEPAEPTPEPVEPTPAPVESTPTPIAATGDGDGAPVGAIVGGVVGGMLLLAVGGGVGYWFLRIRKT